jgi:hypothetical protein
MCLYWRSHIPACVSNEAHGDKYVTELVVAGDNTELFLRRSFHSGPPAKINKINK